MEKLTRDEKRPIKKKENAFKIKSLFITGIGYNDKNQGPYTYI